MKYTIRSLKVTWNFIFWILFFIVIVFSLIELKTMSIPKIYFSSILGALLIFNRMYLVKGRIKRIPYCLNLTSLFFILVVMKGITSTTHFSQSFSAVGFSILKSSYFSASFPLALSSATKVYTLICQSLNLKVLPLVNFLMGVLFCLGIFYPFVTLHIKRLRDIKFPYLLAFITIIPSVHILFEIFLCLKKEAKRSKKKNRKSKKNAISIEKDSPGLVYKN